MTALASRRTAPLVGRTAPQIALSIVVLPAPFGPIRPKISPLSRMRSTPSRACTPTEMHAQTPRLQSLHLSTPRAGGPRALARSSQAAALAIFAILKGAVPFAPAMLRRSDCVRFYFENPVWAFHVTMHPWA